MSTRITLLRWPPALDLAIVATLAFALRCLHAGFLARTPFLEGPTIDSATYWQFAQRIASTGDFGAAFYQPPLYPAFLALLFRIGMKSIWGVEIVQMALGSATAALMVLVGRQLASASSSARAVGFAVGLAAALYGPLVMLDVELLPPALVNLLLVGALVLALRTEPLGLKDAAMGLLSGAAITGWPLSFALMPGLLALRARRLPKASPLGPFVALALTFALLPIALTARHNARHDAVGALVSYNTGLNLWLGNNPNWRDTWRARPGASFEVELGRPEDAGVTKPAASSAYFVGMVGRDVAARPLAALGRTLEKFYYVWHGREIRRNQDIEILRNGSPLLRALIWEFGLCFPFGLVAPLGLLALVRRRREPDIPILAVTVVLSAFVVAVFFVAERYRLPLVLLLLPLAIDQVCSAGATTARGLGVLGATVVALNLPIAFTRTFTADEAERGMLTVRAWLFQGKTERAGEVSAALVRRFPDDANVHMVRAEALLRTSDCSSAIPHLEATVKLAPLATTPFIMLGSCRLALGNEPAALHAFEAALSQHPNQREALKLSGMIHARNGRMAEAQRALKHFVDMGYRDREVSSWLKSIEKLQEKRRSSSTNTSGSPKSTNADSPSREARRGGFER